MKIELESTITPTLGTDISLSLGDIDFFDKKTKNNLELEFCSFGVYIRKWIKIEPYTIGRYGFNDDKIFIWLKEKELEETLKIRKILHHPKFEKFMKEFFKTLKEKKTK
jgi:hypothetical protein